jgi:hypothetical protein
MTARNCLLPTTAVGVALMLAGCATSAPQAKTQESAAQIIQGTSSDTDRSAIQDSDSQIYQAEHAIDPDASGMSSSQNQSIP